MTATKTAPNYDQITRDFGHRGHLPERFALSRRVPTEIAVGDVVRITYARNLSATRPAYMLGAQPLAWAIRPAHDNIIHGEYGFARCVSVRRDAETDCIDIAEFETCESPE